MDEEKLLTLVDVRHDVVEHLSRELGRPIDVDRNALFMQARIAKHQPDGENYMRSPCAYPRRGHGLVLGVPVRVRAAGLQRSASGRDVPFRHIAYMSRLWRRLRWERKAQCKEISGCIFRGKVIQ